MRKSLELTYKYSVCYSIHNTDTIFDRFGFLDKTFPKETRLVSYNMPFIKPPTKCYDNFIDVAYDKAQNLGKVYLAFSGGVDSTLVLALLTKAKKEAIPIYFRQKDGNNLWDTNKEIWKYVSKHYPLKVCNPYDYPYSKLTTCAGADVLYYSISVPPRFVDFINYSDGRFKRVAYPIKELPLDYYDSTLQDYADFVGVKVSTNLNALRLVILGCKYYHYARSCGIFAPLGERLSSFYDDQIFTDIAFTQYWDNQFKDKYDKEDSKRFIKDVFGTDFGVSKNF